MAILIEEEKKQTNLVSLIGFLAVLAVVFIGGYYLFFKKPEFIDVIAPERLQEIKELSGAKFEPKVIVENSIFKELKDYAQPLAPAQKGRTDPFRP